ncbi:uncharacterized protein [Diadema antillarum]|uniref:uncharacterized protein n=1 Tax=Diadema antillarum TaxID=105358 RepID=UPI003A8A4F62
MWNQDSSSRDLLDSDSISMASITSGTLVSYADDGESLAGEGLHVDPPVIVELSTLWPSRVLPAISESAGESFGVEDDASISTRDTGKTDKVMKKRFSKAGLVLRGVEDRPSNPACNGYVPSNLGLDNRGYSPEQSESGRPMSECSVETPTSARSATPRRSDRSRKLITNSRYDFRKHNTQGHTIDSNKNPSNGVTSGQEPGTPPAASPRSKEAKSKAYLGHSRDKLFKGMTTKFKQTKLRRKRSPHLFDNLVDDRNQYKYAYRKYSVDSSSKCQVSLHVFEKAVRSADLDVLKNLLEENSSFNLNKRDRDHLTLLHHAAINNRDAIAGELLQRGADTRVQTLDTRATPLHVAARLNGAEVARVLLLWGASVESTTSKGLTPLHISARRGHAAVTMELISLRRTNVNVTDYEGATPLHYGAMSGNLNVCRLLVENGADIRAKDENNMTPLMKAIISGHDDLVDIFLEKASRIGLNFADYLADTDNESNTCLHLAVSKRRTRVIQTLVDNGVNVNDQKQNGMAPLHIAAINGSTDTVSQLLDNSADIELMDDEGMTPLHRATLYNRVETMALLIHEGAVIDEVDNNGFTPLLCAAWKGHVPAGDLLLTRGADINVSDQHNKTPLHWAAEMDHVDIMKFFLQSGGNEHVNNPDTFERTALHYAAERGNNTMIRLLLEHSAECDAKDGMEKTPVHVAAQAGYVHCVEELLRNTPDLLNEDDRDGMTPLLTACYYGSHVVVMALLKMGADISKVNDEHRTALILAAANNHVMTMSLLIEHNCDINAIDKTKNTALHLCCDAGHIAAANLLIRAGADQSCSNDQGFTPLELAIKREQGEIAAAIIKSKDWQVAMQSRDEQMTSPMKALIEKLPDVALLVMDRCVHRTSTTESHNTPYKVKFDYRYIDPGPDDISTTHNHRRYFAIRTMCRSGREKLLAHELTQSILHRKWRRFGRVWYYSDLLTYVAFICAITALSLLTTTFPDFHFNPEAGTWGACPYYNFTVHPGLANYKGGYFLIDPTIAYLGYFVLIYCLMTAVGELVEICSMGTRYFTEVGNIVDWLTIVTASVFVSPPGSPPCSYNWNAGIIAIGCAWIRFIIYFREFKLTGLYVQMFTKTLVSILKAIAVFVIIILAFSFTFNMWLGNMYSFRDVPTSALTVFIMMLGEIGKDVIFTPEVNLKPFASAVIYILFVAFLFFVPVVLNNLAIGIAVSDVEEIKRRAFIKRNTVLADYVYRVESKCPRWLQRLLHQSEHVVTVKPRGRRKLRTWLFPREGEALFEMMDEKSETGTAEHVMDELMRQRNTLNTMMLLLKQQGEVLRTLADKEGVIAPSLQQGVTTLSGLHHDLPYVEVDVDNDPASSVA